MSIFPTHQTVLENKKGTRHIFVLEPT